MIWIHRSFPKKLAPPVSTAKVQAARKVFVSGPLNKPRFSTCHGSAPPPSAPFKAAARATKSGDYFW